MYIKSLEFQPQSLFASFFLASLYDINEMGLKCKENGKDDDKDND